MNRKNNLPFWQVSIKILFPSSEKINIDNFERHWSDCSDLLKYSATSLISPKKMFFSFSKGCQSIANSYKVVMKVLGVQYIKRNSSMKFIILLNFK